MSGPINDLPESAVERVTLISLMCRHQRANMTLPNPIKLSLIKQPLKFPDNKQILHYSFIIMLILGDQKIDTGRQSARMQVDQVSVPRDVVA